MYVSQEPNSPSRQLDALTGPAQVSSPTFRAEGEVNTLGTTSFARQNGGLKEGMGDEEVDNIHLISGVSKGWSNQGILLVRGGARLALEGAGRWREEEGFSK